MSKLARAVDTVARRPQLQERITYTVADSMEKTLQPHGVIVVVEADKVLRRWRGVNRSGTG